MATVEFSRTDPPSPPRPPNPPPPSPETNKRNSHQQRPLTPRRRNLGDPPSPPRAPPPSPTKDSHPRSLSESTISQRFPRLTDLTSTLTGVLDTPRDKKRYYEYCEDDLDVPESPPELEYTPPFNSRLRAKNSNKRRIEDDEDDEGKFGAWLLEGGSLEHKRQKIIIDLDDALLFLPAAHPESNTNTASPSVNDFFGALFPEFAPEEGTLQERAHHILTCA
ncbi:hypothetical protein AA313_de0200809 [Arthrobotrys entomopaga]|nr:hypothetical protein AA313_de0200809 [Arthrobotrys entomopaga]